MNKNMIWSYKVTVHIHFLMIYITYSDMIKPLC